MKASGGALCIRFVVPMVLYELGTLAVLLIGLNLKDVLYQLPNAASEGFWTQFGIAFLSIQILFCLMLFCLCTYAASAFYCFLFYGLLIIGRQCGVSVLLATWFRYIRPQLIFYQPGLLLAGVIHFGLLFWLLIVWVLRLLNYENFRTSSPDEENGFNIHQGLEEETRFNNNNNLNHQTNINCNKFDQHTKQHHQQPRKYDIQFKNRYGALSRVKERSHLILTRVKRHRNRKSMHISGSKAAATTHGDFENHSRGNQIHQLSCSSLTNIHHQCKVHAHHSHKQQKQADLSHLQSPPLVSNNSNNFLTFTKSQTTNDHSNLPDCQGNPIKQYPHHPCHHCHQNRRRCNTSSQQPELPVEASNGFQSNIKDNINDNTERQSNHHDYQGNNKRSSSPTGHFCLRHQRQERNLNSNTSKSYSQASTEALPITNNSSGLPVPVPHGRRNLLNGRSAAAPAVQPRLRYSSPLHHQDNLMVQNCGNNDPPLINSTNINPSGSFDIIEPFMTTKHNNNARMGSPSQRRHDRNNTFDIDIHNHEEEETDSLPSPPSPSLLLNQHHPPELSGRADNDILEENDYEQDEEDEDHYYYVPPLPPPRDYSLRMANPKHFH